VFRQTGAFVRVHLFHVEVMTDTERNPRPTHFLAMQHWFWPFRPTLTATPVCLEVGLIIIITCTVQLQAVVLTYHAVNNVDKGRL